MPGFLINIIVSGRSRSYLSQISISLTKFWLCPREFNIKPRNLLSRLCNSHQVTPGANRLSLIFFFTKNATRKDQSFLPFLVNWGGREIFNCQLVILLVSCTSSFICPVLILASRKTTDDKLGLPCILFK